MSQYIKTNSEHARKFVNQFESAVCKAAEDYMVDGVICGHVHVPRMLQRDGVTYCNTGDWMDSCTAMVEDFDGELELIKWNHAQEEDAGSYGTSVKRNTSARSRPAFTPKSLDRQAV